MLTTSLADILRAICADPSDDLARLAYADRLEEEGEGEGREAVWLRDAIRAPANGYRHNGEQWLVHRLTRPDNETSSVDALITPFVFAVPLPAEDCTFTRTRGWFSGVACPLAWWLANGAALVAAQPIERVEVTDREPVHFDEYEWWSNGDFGKGEGLPLYHVPARLFDRTAGRLWPVGHLGFPSREAALLVLGRACLDDAREAAGLPPLPRGGAV